jgi:hypothetical protein
MSLKTCLNSPCRTFSSLRISKWVNVTFLSLNNATAVLEKPHRGASGSPFMNKTTLLCFMMLCMRASKSSSVSEDGGGAGGWNVVDWGTTNALLPKYFSIVSLSWVASPPSIRPSRAWPLISLYHWFREGDFSHTHLNNQACRDRIDVKRVWYVCLFFCLHLTLYCQSCGVWYGPVVTCPEREQLRVCPGQLFDNLIHLLAWRSPGRPEVDEWYTLEIIR